ncbi:MAG: metallophosphoesterase family protein [Anaerolineaceae bacterium]|nr:metallophosphoesterase family protein [Anaerolineaceae bacterium]
MKILAVSDKEEKMLYSPTIANRFKDVSLIIGCGDLSYYYQEYILSMLNVPMYYVRGNHAKIVEYGSGSQRCSPWGALDLHRKCRRTREGVILSGVEGCIRYNRGNYQYLQSEMWSHVFSLVPSFLLNRMRFGRFIDVFVSHAPPWGIHDEDDLAHHGAKAFRWLLKVFKPAVHFHGHIHIYNSQKATETLFGKTWVVNAYGYQEIELPLDELENIPLKSIK